MTKVMYTVEEVSSMIKAGKFISVAGVEELLKQLPDGNWIGGTTPYFMSEEGGCVCEDKIYVMDIPAFAKSAKIAVYTKENIKTDLYKDAYEHGYSIIILPQQSNLWLDFFGDAMNCEGFAMKPLAGWVSMVKYENAGKELPAVFCGSGKVLREEAVVLHVELPENMVAEAVAINPYEQGDGPAITVEADTQTKIVDALVDGKKVNLAKYLVENGYDGTLPMIADYCGMAVNVTIAIHADEGYVECFAPVFKDNIYKMAKPVTKEQLRADDEKYHDIPGATRVFACCCGSILIYGDMIGQKNGAAIVGPFTGGEICYQMLNQTNVAMDVFAI